MSAAVPLPAVYPRRRALAVLRGTGVAGLVSAAVIAIATLVAIFGSLLAPFNPNAAIPITTISGITIASLIAVAAVVETAFSLNGLGAYLVQAAQSKDLAVVQGISLLLVTAFVVINVLVDFAYALLDPRVALGSRTA